MDHIETSQKGKRKGDAQQQKYAQQLIGKYVLDYQLKFV